MSYGSAPQGAVHFKLFPYEPALPWYYKQKPQGAEQSIDIAGEVLSVKIFVCKGAVHY
jgi:hypothetical protein